MKNPNGFATVFPAWRLFFCNPRGLMLAAGLLIALQTSSCVSLIGSKHSYGSQGPSATVNGARLRLQVKPEGSSGGSYVLSAMVVSAAVTRLDGPFRWRIEAEGEAGVHESMIVHRLQTRTTTTGRDEWFPSAHLGKRADFERRLGESGPVRAIYELPGLLNVKPREDGALEILADVTVVARGKAERKSLRFRLEPSSSRQNETLFLPTEIIGSLGKDLPNESETGWD